MPRENILRCVYALFWKNTLIDYRIYNNLYFIHFAICCIFWIWFKKASKCAATIVRQAGYEMKYFI